MTTPTDPITPTDPTKLANSVTPSPRLCELADAYLSDNLDELGVRELESLLLTESAGRAYFVRLSQLHADLYTEVRGRLASERALRDLDFDFDSDPATTSTGPRPSVGRVWRWLRQVARVVVPMTLVLSVGVLGWLAGRQSVGNERPTDPTTRTFRLDFGRSVPGTLADALGRGTGLTHRLPGTGSQLDPHDANLRLVPERGQLELTTTNSDINRQVNLATGEYFGVRLAELGFRGDEDFAVSVSFVNIPALEFVGQFGLYAGSRSDCNIRGGVISRREPGLYRQFMVNNHRGIDTDSHFVGLYATGEDLQLTLRRVAGKYELSVLNPLTGNSSTIANRHPHFLDGHTDLFVGIFGANTQSQVRRTLTIREFSVTITKPTRTEKEN